jgi:predicted PurR-regulated permease PerM
MNKSVTRIGLAVLTTLLVLLVLWQFRIVIGYVFISLMLAATIRPLFRHLAGRKVIARILWSLAYIAVGVGLGYLLFLVIRTSGAELQGLAESVSEKDQWIFPVWLGNSVNQFLSTRLPAPSVLLQAVIGNEGELLLPALLGIAQGVGGLVSAIAIILILSIYWGINQEHFERLWLSLLPSDQRKRARSIWRAIEPDTGTYIRGQFFHSILTGLILGIGFWLIGSPYPVLIALLSALACMIPVVGSVLALFPPLLIGLFTSFQITLFTGIYTLIVLIAILIWVKPRFVNKRWDHPILTVVLIVALADAFGIFGIIVAPPLSVILQILWSRLITHRVAAGAATNITDLQTRLNQLRETVSEMEDLNVPLVTSSMSRITNLMAEAEPVLVAASRVDLSSQLTPGDPESITPTNPTG